MTSANPFDFNSGGDSTSSEINSIGSATATVSLCGKLEAPTPGATDSCVLVKGSWDHGFTIGVTVSGVLFVALVGLGVWLLLLRRRRMKKGMAGTVVKERGEEVGVVKDDSDSNFSIDEKMRKDKQGISVDFRRGVSPPGYDQIVGGRGGKE